MQQLSDVTPIINRLIERKNLTAEETEEALDLVWAKDQEGWYIWSLMLALHTKGETSDELLGVCRSFNKFSAKLEPKLDPNTITDTSGTGGDKLKTFNVSTTASFVLAGGGVNVAKQAFFAVTGVSGSAEIYHAIGIDVLKLTPKTVEEALEITGISPYLKTSPSMTGKPYISITRKMSSIGLKLTSPLHLAAFATCPMEMKRRVYGCSWEEFLGVLAELFQKLGYVKGMVVHGVGGIDEVSTIGPTKVAEYTSKKIKFSTIKPRDLGLKKAKFEEVKAISQKQNIIDFLQILYNKEQGPRTDLVKANTAASLYVMDKAKNLKEGVEKAGKIIEKGKAARKLEKLVGYYGGYPQLESWKRKAQIEQTPRIAVLSRWGYFPGKLRVCGVASLNDARMAYKLGVDSLGLIVSDEEIESPSVLSLEKATRIRFALPQAIFVTLVPTFTDPDKIIMLSKLLKPHILQLHFPMEIQNIKKIKSHLENIAILKTVHVRNKESLDQALRLQKLVDGILLDTWGEGGKGSTGRIHNWKIDQEIVSKLEKPVMLAGGITPYNVERATRTVRPRGFVTLTGTEINPGIKDPKKIKMLLAKTQKLIDRKLLS